MGDYALNEINRSTEYQDNMGAETASKAHQMYLNSLWLKNMKTDFII